MKVVAFTGKHRAEIVDRPRPKAHNELVVVKVHAAPMCTEYLWYRDATYPDNYYRFDSLGHEAAGEVVEVHRSSRVKVGDRVVVRYRYPCGTCSLCRRGAHDMCRVQLDVLAASGNEAGDCTFTQYLIKQDWHLAPIPENVSYDHASMAICGLSPTFNAMEAANVNELSTVLITGLGPVGLGGVLNGAFRGARVIAIARSPYRRDLALRLGAETVLNPDDGDVLAQIMDLTHGEGVDCALSTVGAVGANAPSGSYNRLAFDATRDLGDVIYLAESHDVTFNITNDLMHTGKRIQGMICSHTNQMPKLMATIEKMGTKLDPLITHRFPMDRVGEACELQLKRECGKIVLHPFD